MIDQPLTIQNVIGTFNAEFTVDVKPGDAERLRAVAARYRAKAFNVEAVAHRIEGNQTLAVQCEDQAVQQWDFAGTCEREARAVSA